MSQQLRESKKDTKAKLHTKMAELGSGKFKIELLAERPCESAQELWRREGELVKQHGTLNVKVPGRTYTEWVETRREEIRQYKQEHYRAHKEERRQRDRERYLANRGQKSNIRRITPGSTEIQ